MGRNAKFAVEIAQRGVEAVDGALIAFAFLGDPHGASAIGVAAKRCA